MEHKKISLFDLRALHITETQFEHGQSGQTIGRTVKETRKHRIPMVQRHESITLFTVGTTILFQKESTQIPSPGAFWHAIQQLDPKTEISPQLLQYQRCQCLPFFQ